MNPAPNTKPSVVVLAGGPDSEREISLESGRAVAEALRESGHQIEYIEIDRIGTKDIAALPSGVIFPALHGVWGEGGGLQSVLESSGRAYVGSGPAAARLAMDKLATKIIAGNAGVRTPNAGIVTINDPVCCVPLPAVVKPVHEGSSVGLMMCDDEIGWQRAHEMVCADCTPGRIYMAESMIRGRELTVGLVDDGGGGYCQFPLVEIIPSTGVYDYEAKYTRGDTRYIVDPDLPNGVAKSVRAAAESVAHAIVLRHLGRVDFLLDSNDQFWLLEINTMPGFTAASLLPKSAAAHGVSLPDLVSMLVGLAAESKPRIHA